ncbi:MAG: cobalt-precorrin-5B (C(1))-methyltransferase CbiD [Cyanobacteria bacterium J06560_2]
MSGPQSGYTLPVFACAGAIAALRHLIDSTHPIEQVTLNLIEPPKTADIPIEQLSLLSKTSALAITRSDPGDNLDLTRNTPIWSVVSWANPEQTQQIELQGGEGIGQHRQGAAIYSYARQLMQENLSAELSPHQKITVKIILPEGRRLALRTSNAAFGVVDGLSLLGTSGIAQPLSAPGQLAEYRQTLRRKAAKYKDLVFCLGENGLDLALQHGIEADRRLKTANWIGPMLAEAGELKVRSILLFGYHGKLIKLAGGIFHTHHHVADGRQEIMAAYCAQAGLETSIVQQVLTSDTTEAALNLLRKQDQAAQTDWVDRVYGLLAERIDVRSQTYIQNHTEQSILVGSVFFDRQRKIITSSRAGQQLLLSKS